MSIQSSLIWNILHSISLYFTTLTFLKNIVFPLLHFIKIESFSFWVCLMFPSDQIQVYILLPVYYLGDDFCVPLRISHLQPHDDHVSPHFGDVNFDHTTTVLSSSFTIQSHEDHTNKHAHIYVNLCTRMYFQKNRFI